MRQSKLQPSLEQFEEIQSGIKVLDNLESQTDERTGFEEII